MKAGFILFAVVTSAVVLSVIVNNHYYKKHLKERKAKIENTKQQ